MKTLYPFALGLLLICAVVILRTVSIAGDELTDDAISSDGTFPPRIVDSGEPVINDSSFLGTVSTGGEQLPDDATNTGGIFPPRIVASGEPVINDSSLGTPRLQIYSISSPDLLSLLQTKFAEQPNVRLTLDRRTGNLVAMAPPAVQAEIIAISDEMQLGIKVIDRANITTPGSIKTLDQVRQHRSRQLEVDLETKYVPQLKTEYQDLAINEYRPSRLAPRDLRKMAMEKVTELRAKLKSSTDRSAVEPRLRAALAEYFIADMGHRVREIDEIKARIAKTEAELQKRLDAQQESIDLQVQLFIAEAEGLGFFRSEDNVGQSRNPFEGGASASPNN